MNKLTTMISAVMALGLGTSASAQVNLTAETASPSSAPGVSVIALSEAAAKYNVANMQVTTGQTLTNSVQNVAEGKSDVAAAPFVLPFLLSRAVGPYAKVGKEKGAELASKLAVLYTYRIACQGLYAYDSNNFPGYDGIKDARIFNGPPRGAALTNARDLVRLVTGLEEKKDYTGIQVNWGQAVKTIQDGSADANVLPMSFPDARMTAAMASGDILQAAVNMNLGYNSFFYVGVKLQTTREKGDEAIKFMRERKIRILLALKLNNQCIQNSVLRLKLERMAQR